MSIVFRCPECDHKLRAAASAAGKSSRCKCGAHVIVPSADGQSTADNDDEALGGSWRLEPKFHVANGDLCEAITAWSPLCAPSQPDCKGEPAGRPRTTGKGFSSGPRAWSSSPSSSSPSSMPCVPAARRRAPAGQELVQVPGENDPKPGDKPAEVEPPAKVPPVDKGVLVPVQPKPVDGSKTDPPRKVGPREDDPKPAPVELDVVEIVEWFTLNKVASVDEDGKEEPLEANEDVIKAGLVFVAVKARVPAKFLEGKVFVVELSGTVLNTPGNTKPYEAIGLSITDKLWFAPETGRRAYAAPKDGRVTQSWLFLAPLKDLQTGRTTFQIKDQRPVLLTLATRRMP